MVLHINNWYIGTTESCWCAVSCKHRPSPVGGGLQLLQQECVGVHGRRAPPPPGLPLRGQLCQGETARSLPQPAACLGGSATKHPKVHSAPWNGSYLGQQRKCIHRVQSCPRASPCTASDVTCCLQIQRLTLRCSPHCQIPDAVRCCPHCQIPDTVRSAPSDT